MEKITNKAFFLSTLSLVRNKQNTPGIIKYPFWQMTAQNPAAIYICLNNSRIVYPHAIKEQAICINNDIGETLSEITGREGVAHHAAG